MSEKIEVGTVLTIEHGKRGHIVNILVEEIDSDEIIYGVDCDGAEYEMPLNARGEILRIDNNGFKALA